MLFAVLGRILKTREENIKRRGKRKA